MHFVLFFRNRMLFIGYCGRIELIELIELIERNGGN